MNTQVEQMAAPEDTNKAQITLSMLRQWGACSDGKSWFSSKFPQGGQYDDVMLALYADKRFDDANWLASTMLSSGPTSDLIKADVRSIIRLTSAAATTGNWAHAATTGDEAHAATTGNWAHASSDGENCIITCLGIGSHAKLGPKGVAILVWNDGDRNRITSIYEGENRIKPGVWYKLDDAGSPVEVESA